MHKLILNNTGGHPLTLDDLDFEQESSRDAISGIVSAMKSQGQEHFILSGCQQQADESITAGWIVLNGELRKFSGMAAPQTALLNPLFYAFEAHDFYDSNLQVTYNDQSKKDVYQYRSARITTLSTVDVNKPAVGSLQRWDDPWHEVGASGEPAYATSWESGAPAGSTPASDFFFRKDINGTVHFKGSFHHSGLPNQYTFILPEEYWPIERVFVPILGSDSANPAPLITYLTIWENGWIEPHRTSGTSSLDTFWLDGVSFNTL